MDDENLARPIVGDVVKRSPLFRRMEWPFGDGQCVLTIHGRWTAADCDDMEAAIALTLKAVRKLATPA